MTEARTRPRWLPRRRGALADHGFSFIEIMVYMAILGIMALAAVPQIGNYRLYQVVTTMQNDARSYAGAIDTNYTISYKYPDSTTSTANPAFVKGVTASPGDTVTFENDGSSYRILVTNKTAAPTKTVIYDSSKGGLLPVVTSGS